MMRMELAESFAQIGGGNGGYWEDRATPGMPASRSYTTPNIFFLLIIRDPGRLSRCG